MNTAERVAKTEVPMSPVTRIAQRDRTLWEFLAIEHRPNGCLRENKNLIAGDPLAIGDGERRDRAFIPSPCERWNLLPAALSPVQRLKMLTNEKMNMPIRADKASALDLRAASGPLRLDNETSARLARVADIRVRKLGRVTRPTALLIDKSEGAGEVIEAGKQIAVMISRISQARLYVYAFDGSAIPVEPDGGELFHWETAFRQVRAGGRADAGTAIEALQLSRETVEQIILVIGAAEAETPGFADGYDRYARELGVEPDVVVVLVGSNETSTAQQRAIGPESGSRRGMVERSLAPRGAEIGRFAFNGDLESLTDLVPLISRPSRLELLIDALEAPIVARRAPNDALEAPISKRAQIPARASANHALLRR